MRTTTKKKTKTITISGIECHDASDALGWIDASGKGAAISIGDKVLWVEEAEAQRLEAAGICFAYLLDDPMPDGTCRIVAVPVNDD